MRTIRRTLRRNRKNLKKAGWGLFGFFLLFCLLTVQLSATEGRWPTQGRDSAAPPAPVKFAPLNHSSASTLRPVSHPRVAKTPRADFGTQQYAPQLYAAQPQFAPQQHALQQYAPQEFASQPQYAPQQSYAPTNAIPDPSTSPTAVYLQQQPAGVAAYPESYQETGAQYPASEVVYEQAQSIPSSNYFGIGPEDVCDEWNGFGDCDQKMFTRRGAVCSDKDCLGQNGRLGRNLRSERSCR